MAIGLCIPNTPDLKELPHPPVALAVLLVVEEALRKAWQLMLTSPRPGFNLSMALEDEVTFEVHRRLADEVFAQRLVPGFDRQVLGNVTREAKVDSFDGASLDKMPDLIVWFAPGARDSAMFPRQDAIFVECKPVDVFHPTGSRYCDDGIIRFVRGDYAWAMTSAIMVAYSRHGYTIAGKLAPALSQKSHLRLTGQPSLCAKSSACAEAEQVHVTQHARPFKYVENGVPAPPIVIRHLWLRRS